MHEEVSKSEFKPKALEFFRKVEDSGQPLIITDRGHPTVEIRKYRGGARDPLTVLRGSVLRYDEPLEPVGSDDWEALQ